ncbi:MAG: alkaline phosphatase family protein [Myxococcota bacterium]|nr:alkaline phosphatase family protein [Myxococcota bacterium]
MRHTLLLGLLAAALAAGLVSVRRAGDQIAVLDACQAVEDGRWREALSGTERHLGDDETGRAALTCRCRALLATGRADACTALLEAAIAGETESDWMPTAELSAHLIQARRQAGRADEAAALARRAGRAHPDDAELFALEIVTRSAIEDEAAVLSELAARLPDRGPAAVRMRRSLANRHLQRAESERALAVLGATPPADAGDATGLWYEARAMAFATAGDLAGMERTFAEWRLQGLDEDELQARHALALSLGKLEAPGASTLVRLEQALANGPFDAALDEAITIRLILSLVADGRLQDALATYDHGREHFALEGLTREELLRSAEHAEISSAGGDTRPARVRFVLDPAFEGATLSLSPDRLARVDAPYEQQRMRGSVQVERVPDVAPVRWVVHDAGGHTRASGTLSPGPGETRTVQIAPRAAKPVVERTLSRRAADGRRRLVLALLDCADWRLVQYLRTRGELPVLSQLLAHGHSAVLVSDPPLTAAALEALVWPQRASRPGVLGLVHRYGTELAGLADIGDNPFAALEWVLPETRDLFQVIGAGPLTAANLLFSHGGVQAGRHGEITGPEGARRRMNLGSVGRDLTRRERADFPALATIDRERDAIHLRRIAAEFDATDRLVDDGHVDFVALRVESLDILTHAHFASTVRDAQDDGNGLLFSVYRYIDARLGSLHDRLDEDDVLIVMSDHGIRTAMEHSRFAFFVAAGNDVPAGKAPGMPALRGVSRAAADILGIPTRWPDTGVASWAQGPALARSEAEAHPEQTEP